MTTAPVAILVDTNVFVAAEQHTDDDHHAYGREAAELLRLAAGLGFRVCLSEATARDVATATGELGKRRRRALAKYDVLPPAHVPDAVREAFGDVGRRQHRNDVRHATVTRGATNLEQQMFHAVGSLRAQGIMALVVGYGGGEEGVLERVRVAVEHAVAGISIPVYVGIGHHDFHRTVEGATVRTCTTPTDAAALFVAEGLTTANRRVIALEVCEREVRAAGANADALNRALARFGKEMADIDAALQRACDLHMQSTA